LQSIFDSLCEHGITLFDDKVDKNGDKSEDNSQVRQLAFDDSDEDFITSLKQFFETQLDSRVAEIRETAVQGVAKLLMHSRLYSPELLSKLVVIWFTPDENQTIVQFIGDFLRLYALAESQGVIVGQSALQESFLLTLQTLYEQRLKTINCENLIKFFVNLIDDESHTQLAHDLVNKIMDCDQSMAKLAEDYLLMAVNHLNLMAMSAREMKAFDENIQKIAAKFENSKSKTVKKRLAAIAKKIESRSQQLSADSAFEQDFEPIDDVNEDNVAVNDSDAESFRTCPESQSPPQKRRRMTTEELLLSDTNGPEVATTESQESDVDALGTNTSELNLNESMETNGGECDTPSEAQVVDTNDTSVQQPCDPFMTVD
jgi:hypothetical protein